MFSSLKLKECHMEVTSCSGAILTPEQETLIVNVVQKNTIRLRNQGQSHFGLYSLFGSGGA